MIRARQTLRGLLAAVTLAGLWSVSAGSAPAVVEVQILALNDFHGNLEPPAGSNGRIGSVTAGGVEFLARHIAQLRATNPNTVVVSAGDNIGATPLISGLFHDEPAVEALNALGLDISAVGNHELDKGWWELRRMARGGCHPVDGCQDGTPYTGARFQFLAANVRVNPSAVEPKVLSAAGIRATGPARPTLFPASTVKTLGGVKVGFIGITLQGIPGLVAPASLTGLEFHPEAEAANAEAASLRRRGVRAIVVLIHEGGRSIDNDPNSCNGLTGPIVSIVEAMSRDIDVVVSAHTHRSYICSLSGKLLTSAESFSRLVTDIDLTIDRKSGRVVAKTARNVVATRDVAPVAEESAIIAHYKPLFAKIGERVIGSLLVDMEQAADPAGQSPLGRAVADSMLEASSDASVGQAQLALMNTGGIRAELVRPPDLPSGTPSTVTFSRAFDVLPFGNAIVVKTMSTELLTRLLEQQFEGRVMFLQVSKGFSYTLDMSKPVGQRVVPGSIQLNGRLIQPGERLRVATVDYVWNGGDGFSVAKEATEPTMVGDGLDAFVSYIGRHSPLAPPEGGRVRRLP